VGGRGPERGWKAASTSHLYQFHPRRSTHPEIALRVAKTEEWLFKLLNLIDDVLFTDIFGFCINIPASVN
jgi:hypothetical protein